MVAQLPPKIIYIHEDTLGHVTDTTWSGNLALLWPIVERCSARFCFPGGLSAGWFASAGFTVGGPVGGGASAPLLGSDDVEAKRGGEDRGRQVLGELDQCGGAGRTNGDVVSGQAPGGSCRVSLVRRRARGSGRRMGVRSRMRTV